MPFRYASIARSLRGSLLLTLLLLAVAAPAQAEWKVLSAESEAGRAGIEHRHVVIEDAANSQRVAIDVAVFSAKSIGLRVVDNSDGQALAAVMKREKFVCGVNGGYFDGSFEPIGLRIIDGQTIAPLRHARLITGVLLGSSRGVQIVRSREFLPRQKTAVAIQCGPFLADSSQRVSGLNNSAMARRTFAATATKDRVLLGVCSEVSLADLAQILATTPIDPNSKIIRAVNLDGGSSSAFWFLREDGTAFSIPGQKPVRDFVALLPK